MPNNTFSIDVYNYNILTTILMWIIKIYRSVLEEFPLLSLPAHELNLETFKFYFPIDTGESSSSANIDYQKEDCS